MVGKWHLNQEPAAFDYYCVLPGQGSYFAPTCCIRGTKDWPNNTLANRDSIPVTAKGKSINRKTSDLVATDEERPSKSLPPCRWRS
jgi:hypothetical protein